MKQRKLGILFIFLVAILVFTLVGCTEPTTYEVTYSAGEGTGTPPTGGSYAEGEQITLPQATGLEKAGSHFKAWNDGTQDYEAGATYTMPAKAVTFTAQWEADLVMHTVTFDPNNGQDAEYTVQVQHGTAVAKPATDPTIEGGKTFRYWKTESDEEYSFATPVTEDIELTAVYAFKVTFSAGEGEGTVDPMYVVTWTPRGIDLPDGSTLTHSGGKVFNGWKDESDVLHKTDVNFVGTGNHTLTADWVEPATGITVSFQADIQGEGDAPASIMGKNPGDEVTLPSNTFAPKADFDNYEFKGWYVSGDIATLYQPNDKYTIPADFTGDSLVFLAKWEPIQYTITYKAGDHATGADITKTVIAGSKTSLLGFSDIEDKFTPENGYELDGWFKEGGTEDDFYFAGDDYTPDGDTTFIAQWTPVYLAYSDGRTAIMQLYLEYGIGMIGIPNDPDDDLDDVYLNLYFEFYQNTPLMLIWFADENFEPIDVNDYAIGTASTAVNVALTYDTTTHIFGTVHTVTYNPNNDEETWTEYVADGLGAAEPDPAPEHSDGKTFRYWKTESGTEYTFEAPLDGDIELTAVYAYKVTFSAGEGAGEVPAQWVTMWTARGIDLPDGKGLTHSGGKTFDGWTDESGATYKAGDRFVGTANHTLTAIWVEPATGITISFETNFQGEGDGPDPITGKNPGDQVALPPNTFTHTSDYPNHVFAGWYVKGQSNTDLYQEGDMYTIPADFTGNSIIFRAKWIEGSVTPASVTVTFKTNYYGEGNGPVDITGKHPGDQITLPPNTFTPKADYSNYEFAGWYVSGTFAPLYQTGDTYTIPADYASDSITFMAKWVEGSTPVVTYTVTYKCGDHATGADITKTINAGDKTTLLGGSDIAGKFTAEKDYYLIGWIIENTANEYSVGAEYEPSANTVFVAKWLHAYACNDIGNTAMIQLQYDTINGFLMPYATDIPIPLTFTLTGTAISITLEGGTAVSGTFADDVLTITLTYDGKTYTFGQTETPDPTEPTITFSAGEGTGDTAPTATVAYISASGQYKIVLPANTYTAPAGKEFKCWSIGGKEWNVGAGYMADPGETVTITAVWKDIVQETPTFEGTVFTGSCTTPVIGMAPYQKGGQTYLKLIISTDKTKVQYTLFDDNNTTGEANLTDESSSNWKPDKYGTDALYYSVQMENVSYHLLMSADMTKLSMCDGDDNLLGNGEFTTDTGETSEYANVFLSNLKDKKFVLSGDATEIYNGYTTLEFTWDSNFSSYKLKLGKTGSTTGTRSFTTAAGNEGLNGTTFTANYSTRQVMTFAFIQDGTSYKMVIISIKDTDGTEHLSAPITLVEEAA